jgi:hypothetical protein
MTVKSKSIAETHSLKIKVVELDDLTSVERKSVLQLLASLNTVKDVETASRKLESAYKLALAKYNGTVYGVAVLRKSETSYMQKLIGRSGISGLPHDSLELCWIAAKRSVKGLVENVIVSALTNAHKDSEDERRIFAVYNVDNTCIADILNNSGFVMHDHDHEALVGGKRAQLWLLA